MRGKSPLVFAAVLVWLLLPAVTRPAASSVGDRLEIDGGGGTVILARTDAPGDPLDSARPPRLRELSAMFPVAEPPAGIFDDLSGAPAILPDPDGAIVPLVPQPGSVIGTDDRRRVLQTRVYPASAATFILVDTGERNAAGRPESSLCSGAIVGTANLVVTAGHCVYDPETGRWFEDWRIYPGARSASRTPYGSCGWRRVYTHRRWMRRGNWDYDVAAIVLDCQVGNRTGWLGARPAVGNGYVSGTHQIHQYPGDKRLATQWVDAGTWDFVDRGRRAYYRIDTAGGSSGAPVIQRQPDGTYYTNATHAYGGSADVPANSGAIWWGQPWKRVLMKAFTWATR